MKTQKKIKNTKHTKQITFRTSRKTQKLQKNIKTQKNKKIKKHKNTKKIKNTKLTIQSTLRMSRKTNKSHKKLKTQKHKKIKKHKNTKKIKNKKYTKQITIRMSRKTQKYKKIKKHKNTKKIKNKKYTKQITIRMSSKIQKHKKIKKQKNTKQIISKTWSPSNKNRNSTVKQYNGNIKTNNLKIMQCNLGNKNWSNKITEIQTIINELNPDICFVTEANLHNSTPNEDRIIPGYKLEYPLTRENPSLEYSRIIAIIKENITVQVLKEHMSTDISSIWLKIVKKGPKKLVIGGTYREHKFLYQNDDSSNTQAAQLSRWQKTLNQWAAAGSGTTCFLLGDCNVDMLKWNDIGTQTTPFINLLQNTIITQGFTQHIRGPTRFWPGCVSTLIDHCWTNSPDKLLSHRNILRAASDHNPIEAVITTKKQIKNCQETLLRKKMSVTKKEFCNQLRNKNWTQLYSTDNPDVAYAILEDNISEVLDKISPIIKTQPSKNNKSWITKQSREKFVLRDKQREKAVNSGDPIEWNEYKKLRNACSKMAINDNKKVFF